MTKSKDIPKEIVLEIESFGEDDSSSDLKVDEESPLKEPSSHDTP
jgi:hypothetical protein